MPSKLIDGSTLEGGGQILRNSVALAALLSTPLSIHNIRANRSQPGLKSQHAAGLRLAAEISSARLSGASGASRALTSESDVSIGSTEVDFIPGRIRTGIEYTGDAITAGSTTLLLQIALPMLVFSHEPQPTKLTLLGGTNATQAPQADYAQHVLLPFCRQTFGLDADLAIPRRGYYPKGGGRLEVTIRPVTGPLRPVTLLRRGKVQRVRGIAHVAGVPRSLAEQMAQGARNVLRTLPELENIDIDIECTRERNDNTAGAGSGIVLWAELDGGGILGGSAVGKKGASAASKGEEAAGELLKALDNGGCVDEWLQDQVIIFMALAGGESALNIGKDLTLHTKTAIWVAEQLTDAKFTVEVNEGMHVIQCQGIGYTAPSA
ncbi:RNA 3'-terminal phosphate cyclase [Schizophyllum commune H4-8]|uniref:RNA 3'-terminal phosphate cyclase n=1 Tax=Schizophyllum commune (strain H4-8 / FGSC 9210) TaxID=578458 RepID=D8PW35_SCHCM|nr:RNA 3'-terminal phosphate cyclase [Schizophyllum commune H4-8]KAI5900107.1 RNA 3'-terminal phosphate cyclase [Schizophyllum commune H4-8]